MIYLTWWIFRSYFRLLESAYPFMAITGTVQVHALARYVPTVEPEMVPNGAPLGLRGLGGEQGRLGLGGCWEHDLERT